MPDHNVSPFVQGRVSDVVFCSIRPALRGEAHRSDCCGRADCRCRGARENSGVEARRRPATGFAPSGDGAATWISLSSQAAGSFESRKIAAIWLAAAEWTPVRSPKRPRWSKRASALRRRFVILNKFAKAEEEGGGMEPIGALSPPNIAEVIAGRSIYIYTHIHTYIYIYLSTYTHTHTHTHIYIYINILRHPSIQF